MPSCLELRDEVLGDVALLAELLPALGQLGEYLVDA